MVARARGRKRIQDFLLFKEWKLENPGDCEGKFNVICLVIDFGFGGKVSSLGIISMPMVFLPLLDSF
jgi:hypothetical protein